MGTAGSTAEALPAEDICDPLTGEAVALGVAGAGPQLPMGLQLADQGAHLNGFGPGAEDQHDLCLDSTSIVFSLDDVLLAVQFLPQSPQLSSGKTDCTNRQGRRGVVLLDLFMQRRGIPVIDRSAAQPLQLQRTSLFSAALQATLWGHRDSAPGPSDRRSTGSEAGWTGPEPPGSPQWRCSLSTGINK